MWAKGSGQPHIYGVVYMLCPVHANILHYFCAPSERPMRTIFNYVGSGLFTLSDVGHLYETYSPETIIGDIDDLL